MQGIKLSLDQQSIAKVKSDFKNLINELQKSATVDINLNKINEQIKTIESTIKNTNKKLHIFDESQLKQDNIKVFQSIDEIKKAYEGLGEVNFSSIFKDADENITGMLMTLKQADGIIKNIKFDKINISGNGNSLSNAFVIDSIKDIDKTAEIAEKQAQKIQVINRQITEEHNKELEKQRQAKEDYIKWWDNVLEKEDNRIKSLGEFKGNVDTSLFSKSNDEIKEYVQNLYGAEAKIVSFRKNNIDSTIRMTVTTKNNKNIIEQESLVLDKNSNALYKNSEAIKNNNSKNVGFIDRMKNAFVAVTSFATVTTSFYGVIRSVRNGIKDISKLDSSMVSLRKVTDETEETYKSFIGVANETAIAVGHSTTAAIDATTAFAKLGYSLKEASDLGKTALIYSNIGDIDIEEATQSIISTYKAYGDEIENVTEIIDVANEVGNNWAITTGGIGSALQRSASALAEANNSYQESVSLITAANSSIQNTDKVGNALKTISMRLRGVSEDGDETVSTLREVVKNMTNVDIMEDDNTFKSTFQIVKDLQPEYDKLSDKNRAFLNELIAGKQQGNVFASLMQNAKDLEKIYQTATNSLGSSATEQAKYMESISARVNTLREEIIKFWHDTIDTDLIKGFVSGLTLVVKTFGNLPSVVGLATTALLVFKGKALMTLISDLMAAVAGESALTVATVGLTSAFNTLKVAFASNPIGMIALGLSTLVGIIALTSKKTEELTNKFSELSSEMQNVNTNANLINQYKQLSQEIDKNNKLGKDTTELKEKQIDLQKQLAQSFPEAIDGYTSENEAIVKSIDNIEKLNEARKNQILATAGNSYNDLYGKLNDSKTKVYRSRTDGDFEQQLPSLIEKYKQLSKARDEALSNGNQSLASKYAKDIEPILKDVEEFNKASIQLYSIGMKNAEIFDFQSGKMVKYSDYLEEANKRLKENTKELEKNAQAQQNGFDSQKGYDNAVKAFSESLSKAKEDLKLINETLDQYNDSGEINLANIIKLSEEYPDLLNLLSNEEELEKRLVQIKGERVDKSKEVLAKQIKNEETYLNEIFKSFNSEVSEYKTAQEAKLFYASQFSQKLATINELIVKSESARQQAIADGDQEAYELALKRKVALVGLQTGIQGQMAGVNTSIDNYYKLKQISLNSDKFVGTGSKSSDGKTSKDSTKYTSDIKSEQTYSSIIQEQNDKLKTQDNLLDSISAKISEKEKAEETTEAIKYQNQLLDEQKNKLDLLSDSKSKYTSTLDTIKQDFYTKFGTDISALSQTELNNIYDKMFTGERDFGVGEVAQKLKDEFEDNAGLFKSMVDDWLKVKSAIVDTDKSVQDLNSSMMDTQLSIKNSAKEGINDYLEAMEKIDKMALEQKHKIQREGLEKSIYDGVSKDEWLSLNQEKIDNLDKVIDSINKASELEDERADRIEKQNNLIKLQAELQNIQQNKNVRELQKQSDGSYQYSYTYDRDTYNTKLEELQKAQIDYVEWEKDITRKRQIEALTQAKKNLEDIAKEKERQYSKQIVDLEKAQEIEKNVMELHYSDMESLAQTHMDTLYNTYEGNWTKIIELITAKVSEAQNKYAELANIQARTNEIKLSENPITPIIKADNVDIKVETSPVGSSSQKDYISKNFPNLLDDYLRITGAKSFDSGGNTGSFSGGKVAVLHQKEQVLNQAQTQGWLKLVDFLPKIVPLLNNFKVNLPDFSKFTPVNQIQSLETHYHIDNVELPNITNESGIANFFDGLTLVSRQRTATV